MADAATPGPWTVVGKVERVEGTDLWCGSIIPVSAPKFRGSIASVQSCDHIGGINIEEARANAYLLAAASELLAVCRAIESHCRVETPETRGNVKAHTAEGHALRARMQAAIASATGAAK